jgi:nicotinic acid mononucleotide adenylyltransferase
MKTFRQFFKEQADDKTAVIAYGRYNPPTIGHQKLIDKVSEVSKRELADGYIVPSHSVDNKKNPLSFEEKKQILNLMVTDVGILDSGKTFIELLKDLQSKGYTNIIHIAGSDRIPEFEKLVSTYNNKPDKNNIIPFSFKDYKFESAGERDPDSEGVTGMSASKLRQLAMDGNLEEFKSGIPESVSDDIKVEIYDKIRNRIK